MEVQLLNNVMISSNDTLNNAHCISDIIISCALPDAVFAKKKSSQLTYGKDIPTREFATSPPLPGVLVCAYVARGRNLANLFHYREKNI